MDTEAHNLSEQAFPKEALHALDQLTGSYFHAKLDLTEPAQLTLKQDSTEARFDVLFRRRLGKEAAAQVVASEGARSEQQLVVITGHVTQHAGTLLHETPVSRIRLRI